jgi:hypothetical protein
VSRLLAAAQRRSFTNLFLEQSSLALAIGMGGAILLLLAGSAIFDWYWVVLVAVASLAVGIYRLRATVPSKYRLAQRIDRRLHLADALSTAFHFSSEEAFGDPAIREAQRQEAESVARSVDVRAAVPFSRPRFLLPAVALAAVAFGLFAVRFAVLHTMSLQPSLAKAAFDTFFPPKKDELAKNQKSRDLSKNSPDQADSDSPTTQQDQQPDSTLNPEEQPDTTNAQAADNSKDAAKGEPQADQNQQPGDQQEKGDKSQNGNDASNNDANKSQDGKSADQKSGQDSKQSSDQNSSLMDKLKDALSNMMNKMKPSESKNGSQQQNAQKDGQSGQQKSNQKGQQSQKQAQNESSSQSEQSDSGEKNQTADAKGAEKSSDKNASQDSKSGIGSADGDKAAREAEQLQAMGKISEIFGKRAQNVTGEVMVEVGSSKQQLKTPWAPKQATHSDAGGDIHRDEVPLIYQQFVEQYFEQIHKTPATPKTKSSK